MPIARDYATWQLPQYVFRYFGGYENLKMSFDGTHFVFTGTGVMPFHIDAPNAGEARRLVRLYVARITGNVDKRLKGVWG